MDSASGDLQLLDCQRAHYQLFLTKRPRELIAIRAPPVAVERVDHDFDSDDLVAVDLARRALPQADRRRAHERGDPAKPMRQFLTDRVERGLAEALAGVVHER